LSWQPKIESDEKGEKDRKSLRRPLGRNAGKSVFSPVDFCRLAGGGACGHYSSPWAWSRDGDVFPGFVRLSIATTTEQAKCEQGSHEPKIHVDRGIEREIWMKCCAVRRAQA
jgi:hypothetical protein